MLSTERSRAHRSGGLFLLLVAAAVVAALLVLVAGFVAEVGTALEGVQ